MKAAILLGCVLLTAASVSAQARRMAPLAPPDRPASHLPARVQDVDCDQGQTIGGAVARLAARGQDPLMRPVIRVAGACHESVVIEGFDRLLLQGRPGATLTGLFTASETAALTVVSSRRVEIQDLSIDAGWLFGGIVIQRCQDCAVRRTAIANGSVSLVVAEPGFTAISDLRSSGAGVGGVWVRANASASLSGALIEGTGSGWLGVWAYDNASLTLVGTTVRGFFGGVGADTGGSVAGADVEGFTGDRTIRIESNGYAGVWAAGRSYVALGTFDVPVVVTNNASIGVVAVDASVSLYGNVQISNHSFVGLYADQQAHLTLSNTEISNSPFSLWASLLSLVSVNGPVTVSGSTTDIQCDASSIVSGAGNIAGTDPSRISCSNLQ